MLGEGKNSGTSPLGGLSGVERFGYSLENDVRGAVAVAIDRDRNLVDCCLSETRDMGDAKAYLLT